MGRRLARARLLVRQDIFEQVSATYLPGNRSPFLDFKIPIERTRRGDRIRVRTDWKDLDVLAEHLPVEDRCDSAASHQSARLSRIGNHKVGELVAHAEH